jgi:hypothetical protein
MTQLVAHRPHWMHFAGSSCQTISPAMLFLTARAATPPIPTRTEALTPAARNFRRLIFGLFSGFPIFCIGFYQPGFLKAVFVCIGQFTFV